jgi:hypothetical protein
MVRVERGRLSWRLRPLAAGEHPGLTSCRVPKAHTGTMGITDDTADRFDGTTLRSMDSAWKGTKSTELGLGPLALSLFMRS